MDNIPLEDQLVIDELVGLWQTRSEPNNLLAHIRGTLKDGCGSITFFFAQVRQNLLTDKHSDYAASSTFEFRQFLEAEYRRLYQPYAERQAKQRAEIERQAQIKAENERRARADFDALGQLLAKSTDRKESIEIARKREDLAPHTGRTFSYENHCWNCKSHISSAIHARCKDCRWYICSSCGSCSPDC